MRELRHRSDKSTVRLSLMLLISAAATSCGPSKPPLTPAEEYPGVWMQPSAEVYRTMHANGFRCGEGYQKASARMAGEYLVYCREANGAWTAYLVWPLSGKTLGPDRAFAYTKGIALPERSDAAVAIDPD